MKDMEKENKVLHQVVTENSSKLGKLECEKQCLHQDLEQVETVKRVEELEKELHQLEKENEKLAQKFTFMTTTATEKIGALELENQGPTLENQEEEKHLENSMKHPVGMLAAGQRHKEATMELLQGRTGPLSCNGTMQLCRLGSSCSKISCSTWRPRTWPSAVRS
ncbi:uncharacterized protein WM277_019608 isoform 1-T2 [Molossus nigricans]